MHTYKTIGFQDLKHGDTYELSVGRYTGTLDNALLPSGSGTLVYKNGITIQGTFVKGLLSGPDAKMLVPGLGSFQGRVEQGEFVSGTITYENGDHYQGGIKLNKPHGQGAYTFSNLDMMVGEFDQGALNGAGITRKGTLAYKGEFVRGILVGEAMVIDVESGLPRTIVIEDGKDVTRESLATAAAARLKAQNEKELSSLADQSNIEAVIAAKEARQRELRCKEVPGCSQYYTVGRWCYNEARKEYSLREDPPLYLTTPEVRTPSQEEREAADRLWDAKYRACNAEINGLAPLVGIGEELRRLQVELEQASNEASAKREAIKVQRASMEAKQQRERAARLDELEREMEEARRQRATREYEQLKRETRLLPDNSCQGTILQRACNCPCVTPQ